MVDVRRIRRMGLVGLLGGLLLVVYGIPDAIDPETFSGAGATARWYGLFLMVPMLCVLVGLVGLHRLHRNQFGRLGRWSTYCVGLGLVIMVLSLFYGYAITGGTFELFGVEDGAFIVLVVSFFVLVLLGSIPLGFAAYRTRVLPAVGPLLLLLSVPVGFAGFAIFLNVFESGGPFVAVTTPYGIAWTVLGYQLWSRPEQ